VPAANWFEMVAAVGSDGKVAVPVGHGQFAANAWKCPATGPLYFFANDAKLSAFGHDFYQNNSGTIHVTVRRVA
jgi:hypothetical protein